jgi:hypothetical protein
MINSDEDITTTKSLRQTIRVVHHYYDGTELSDGPHASQNTGHRTTQYTSWPADEADPQLFDVREWPDFEYYPVTTDVNNARNQGSAYFATHIDSSLKPYHWYKEHVLRGVKENGFPVDCLFNNSIRQILRIIYIKAFNSPYFTICYLQIWRI